MSAPDPRQPAYDAVYAYLRDNRLPTRVTAHVWRAVHAALNAAEVGHPVDPETGVKL